MQGLHIPLHCRQGGDGTVTRVGSTYTWRTSGPWNAAQVPDEVSRVSSCGQRVGGGTGFRLGMTAMFSSLRQAS